MDHTTTRLRPVRCRAEQLDARSPADLGPAPRPPLELLGCLLGPSTPDERDQLRHVLDRLLEVAS